MKAIVIYDSLYGNTEQIAKAIGGGIGGEVKVVKVGEADAAALTGYDLIAVGSPTQGGRHTKVMQAFLAGIPDGALKNVSVAAFDTRIKTRLVKLFGYAAARIGDALKDQGGNLIASPEPFFVNGTKGPLSDGELERAAAWGKTIAASLKQ